MSIRRGLSCLAAILALAGVASGADPIYSLTSTGSGGFPGFGSSVANAGDLDLDGVADVMVGAPYEAPLPLGTVKVFSGMTGAPLLTPLKTASSGHYGFAVAGIGDVDGDGVPDLLIGGPQFNGVSPGPGGMCDVRSGLDGSLLYSKIGDGPSDELGCAVAGIGDVDLDGVPDWIVGATEDHDFNKGPGYVRVFSGATGAPLYKLSGASVGSRFGASAAGAGDVNLDGRADFLVGAPGSNLVQLRSGTAGAQLWSKAGPGGSSFGTDVEMAGDIDGDGNADLVAGGPAGDLLRILRLSNGATVATVTGPPDSFFGGAVAALGDVNGDDRADFLVGAKWADGPATPFAGAAYVYSGEGLAPIHTFYGAVSGDRVGFAVAGVGDADGDGIADAAIGANQDGNAGEGFVDLRAVRPVLIGTPDAISLATGGTHALSIDGGSGVAGDGYVVLGSISGSTPGIVVQGKTVPLNLDAYLLWTLAHPGFAPIAGGLGTLDSQGRANASFGLPAGLSPSFAGIEVAHAVVVFDPATSAITLVSNPATVELAP